MSGAWGACTARCFLASTGSSTRGARCVIAAQFVRCSTPRSPRSVVPALAVPLPPSLLFARAQQRSAQLLAVAKLLGVHDLRRWIDGTNCKLDTDSLAREGCPQHVTWSNCKGWDVARRIPEDGLDLLEGMMKWDPAERLTAEQAMRHPYFQAEWGAHAT